MLIEFTVGNYRSFKDPQTLSLVATPLKSKDKRLDANNVIEREGQPTLLTSAAIYGANASGKSNLLQAISFMRRLVLSSPRWTERIGGIEVEPFRLNVSTLAQPSYFEVVFVAAGTRYRYGFEVTTERVEREWLDSFPSARKTELFDRHGNEIKLGRSFQEGRKELPELTRPNALFLSVVAQFNDPVAAMLVNWFAALTSMRSGSTFQSYAPSRTRRYLEHPALAKELNDLIQRLDLSIRGVHLEEVVQLSLFPDEDPIIEDVVRSDRRERALRERARTTVRTSHTLYDENGQPAGEEFFDLDEHESEGTRRLFTLAGPLLDTLRRGGALVIDELDARLHPLMTREIVRLFNDRQTNPRGAQLVFTTQDTNLLDNELFRRDQIWFVEKDRYGASQLYSLAEFKGVRNDLSFEPNYIQGRFGAVPYLNLNKLQALVAADDGVDA